MIRAIPDDEGWVHTLITQEVPDGVEVPVPAGEVVLPRWPPVELPFLRVGGAGSLYTPHDDRAAWRRLRQLGHSGPEACGLARQRSLGRLPDSEIHVVLPPSGRGITHDFPDVPGLRLRPLGADDLDVMAPSAIAAGTHLARCPGDPPCCRPPEAHAWLRLAERIDRDDTWQQTLEFEGQPLQMELILVTGDQAMFSYTTHFTRERPHWFWREAERPIFERLKAGGVRSVVSRTRADRPDWVQALKDNYGAVDDGVWDQWTVRLRFDPDEALRRCAGWPQRKTLPGWTWQRGRVLIREATDADVVSLPSTLEALWTAGHPRLAIAQKILRQWFALDRATVLLGYRDDVLTDVRVARARRGAIASFANVSRLTGGAEQDLMSVGFAQWLADAGYTHSTMFVPAHLLEQTRGLMEKARFSVVAQRQFEEPQVEMIQDLSAFLRSANA